MSTASEVTTKPAIFDGAGPERVYYDALLAGIFQIQQCGACNKHVFYPRVVCVHCGSPDLRWVTPSGKGVVYSTTVVRRKADAGGDINVALIDLEEGVRMMSRVENLAPDQVKIGMVVTAKIISQKDQILLVFNTLDGNEDQHNGGAQ